MKFKISLTLKKNISCRLLFSLEISCLDIGAASGQIKVSISVLTKNY